MHFDLTDEQKSIRETIGRLLTDRLDMTRALALSNAGGLDPELWREAADLGVTSVLVGEDDGGLGMDLLTLAVIGEELGRAAAGLPVAETALAAWAVARFGSEAQKAQWLERLATGAAVGALALAQEGVRPDPRNWSLTEGSATGAFYPVAWAGQADVLIIGLADGRLGLIAADAPGVTITEADPLDRTRPHATVQLDGAAVEALPGSAEAGALLFDAVLVILAADAYGAAKRSIEIATDYAKERKQFDRLIGSFQAVKHQLANLVVEIEPSRALVWYAAHAWDAIPEDRSRAAALAKSHLGSVAVRTTRLTVELHGGIGYTWDYPLHLWLKRTMFDKSYLGLPSHHAQRAADLAGW
ncbi:acyl-CoA dehydrogenase family protein [Paracoccus sp. J55]|uniref:acyl-CoA dehydrogenase family protein n=1 Tax=Paracoccus sp. J55 TaxID=935849 RepID=UPI0004AF0738|nr:acyl-CoA dehydrogenase family protein [Paracoccus sp. J55]